MGTAVPASDLPPDLRGTAVPASDLPPDASPLPSGKSVPVTAKPKADPLAPAGEFMHEVPRAMAQNLGAKVASGYTGALGAVLPGPTGQGAAWQKATEDALSFDPKSKTSQAALKVLGLPYEYLIEKPVGYVADKVGKGSPLAGSLIKGAGEAAPLAFGLRKTAQADPKVRAAGERGLAITPEEANAGLGSQILSGLSGEPKLAKGISRKNQPVLNEMIVDDLGLPKGTVLERPELARVRAQEHAAYQNVRQLGQIPTDAAYAAALDAIDAAYANAAKSFPTIAPKDVTKTVDGLRVNAFDASAAVDMIRILREQADTAYRQGDTGLGKAHKQAAQVLEDQIDRHLSRAATTMGSDMSGVPGTSNVVDVFRSARERIAKTYAAEKALDAQGNINPQVYAKELKKGKPLTGGALDVAEFARDFPRSAQRPSGANMLAPTAFDTMLGGSAAGIHALTHGVSGGALTPAVAALLARPATRGMIASDPYQAAFIRNRPSSGKGLAVSEVADEGTGK